MRRVGLVGPKGDPRRRSGLRFLYPVAAAILALLVPVILIAGFWVRDEFSKNRQDVEEYLFARANAVSRRIDAEIGRDVTVLQALAAMASLDPPDLQGFRADAERFLGVMPRWAVIGLIDPATGRQLANSLRGPGEELPATTQPEAVRRVVETRRPEIATRPPDAGGVYSGHAVLIFVPVIRGGEVRHVLAAGLDARLVQAIVGELDGEPRLLTVVIDEQARILARSRAAERFVATPANENLQRATAGKAAGLFVAPTLEGEEVFTAFRRSPLTGWMAVTATDRRQFDTLSRRSTWTLIGTGALTVTLAGVLAAFLFSNALERRLSEERLGASKALGDLDARLLSTTQEALAEQRKAASEREVLLREIYHRVKNNLQIVQSLLRLGSRNLNAEQREPFEGAVRRIGAMARVHTLLYNSPDLNSVDFKDYLNGLVSEVAEAFGADERGIRTELDLAPIRVPLDTAVPLAFIAVELLTNAFKHGFPPGRVGTIRVSAGERDGRGWLAVTDDGVGPPPGPARQGSLGLTIVAKLVQQIGGTLERPQEAGAAFKVDFPMAHAAAALPLPQGAPQATAA